MFRHTKLILLLCAFIFLGYVRSFAVVPYPEATAAAPEAQIAPPQINDLQDRMQAQMAAADALIAGLEQQVNYFTGLFATINANNKAGI